MRVTRDGRQPAEVLDQAHFGITSEPKGAVARPGKALGFVIQKHAARRLHYDFRLELDGTLKSWAVPKGPSLDPADKRMAVHVEDHPLAYATFEGVIPPGQYGAGTVIVWDRGVWIPDGDPREGYRQGKLKFELHGEKLQGRWTLVRMRGRGNERQEPWLLIKERDETAKPAAEYDITEALPDSVNANNGARAAAKPARGSTTVKKTSKKRSADSIALPTALESELTACPGAATCTPGRLRSHQRRLDLRVKFDGYRVLARVDGSDVRLFTRRGHDWTSRLKHLAQAIAALKLSNGWIDGEIVIQLGKAGPISRRCKTR